MGGLPGLRKGNLGLVPLSPLLLSAPTLEAGHRGPLRTKWSFQRPELQASQTQLQPGNQVTSYLLLQLDQLDCGDGKARLGLCSTTWSFRAQDRKSTRLNSSHANISYAVF